MVTTLAPVAIFIGIAATAALIFYSVWTSFSSGATEKVRGLRDRLEIAGIRGKPEEIVVYLLAIATLLWVGTVFLTRPSLVVAALLGPIYIGGVGGAFYWYIGFATRRRIDAFVQQLELALRLVSSGVRVGLGLRQAFNLVIEEMSDPARSEFARVIGQTNIGVSLLDALDDLAARMPSNETMMMARVIRVQSQTGGDLAKVLENLAATIKDRRRIQRKITALTAEGRMSALVLMLVPLGLGFLIGMEQPPMGSALLFSGIGHGVMLTIAVMEIFGFFWLRKILAVEV
jgi:tight adherence protein B